MEINTRHDSIHVITISGTVNRVTGNASVRGMCATRTTFGPGPDGECLYLNLLLTVPFIMVYIVGTVFLSFWAEHDWRSEIKIDVLVCVVAPRILFPYADRLLAETMNSPSSSAKHSSKVLAIQTTLSTGL